jgi:Xaa-Pro aminopeptidase
MNLTTETVVLPVDNGTPPMAPASGSDRRADVESKQACVAALLQEVGCDGLLLMEPDNFAWFTSGAAARGILDPAELPVLYVRADQRWVISCNVDSQRLFDEELDGLGFQLKEWPWHWGRAQLVADLCHERRVACDRPLEGFKVVSDRLRSLRRALTPYEQACYAALGKTLCHALEATCRTVEPNTTEREVAGQLSHRLVHRGVQPIGIEVAADGRSRRYRQCGYLAVPVRHYCLLRATARKYGLCVTASRSVSFGDPDATLRKEHNAACKVSATYIASSWPDAVPSQILSTGRHVYQIAGFEHEWRLCPQGHITGRVPVELNLLPEIEDLFHTDWAITWHASIGAALSCDTFLITERGPQLMTPTDMWPMKRIRVQGAEFFRPDVLVR